MKKVFFIITVVATLTGCYMSELTDTTHPGEGKVEVEILLPTLAEGQAAPDSYTVIVGSHEITAGNDEIVELTTLLEPGEYYVYVHSNPATGLSVENNINESGQGMIIATAETENDMVRTLPEHFYFGLQKIIVLADAVVRAQVELSQISRDINFNLYISEGDPDRISAIAASISGIANQWECVSDVVWGSATTIDPSFMQGESLTKSTVANDYITGSIRVLGIIGAEQTLTLNITYSDGRSQTITSDISAQLANANINKPTAITLSGDINTPIESDADGSITNWEEGSGGEHTVN